MRSGLRLIGAVLTAVVLPMSAVAQGSEFVPRANKTAPTFYDAARRANVQRNVERYDWARVEYDEVIAAAKPYTMMSDETLWKMIPAPVIPRAIGVNRDMGCPSCGDAIYGDRGASLYAFEAIVPGHPWKVRCPNCKELFPKNDFAKFYASGISPEDGLFHYELADRSLLLNVDHPDPNDPKHMWCVDDGRGWVDPAKGSDALHLFVACTNYRSIWTQPSHALGRLCRAYAYSGELIYAHKALVLMDRLADVYPDLNGINAQIINFRPGAYWNGIVGPDYWASGLAGTALNYDMIYDAMDKVPEAMAFIQGQAKKYTVPGDKSTVRAIRDHIEQRIFIDRMTTKRRSYQMNGTLSEMVEAQIDMVLRGREAIDQFAEMHMPRIVPPQFLNEDGSGNERSTGYDSGAFGGYCSLLVELADLDLVVARNAIERYPRFKAVFEFWPDIFCLDAFIPNIGDTATVIGDESGFPCPPGPYVKLFEMTGRSKYAQVAMRAVNGDMSKLPRNIFSPEPVALHEKIAETARSAGPLVPPSLVKKDYKLGILRSGKGDDRTALWMFYSPQPGTSSHSHFDALNVGLFAFGDVVVPEQGYPLFTGDWPGRWNWTSHTRSHATVVVDGHCQKHCGGGKLLGFSGGGKVQFVAAEARCAYDGMTRYERTLVLIELEPGRTCFVDVFRVIAGGRHTYTMPFYYGNVDYSGPELVDAGEMYEGYVEQARRGKASGPWRVDVAVRDEWEGRTIGHIRARGTAFEGDIILGNGQTRVGAEYPQRLPYLFLERQGPSLDSTFVVLYELYEGTPLLGDDAFASHVTPEMVQVRLQVDAARTYTMNIKDGGADHTTVEVDHQNGPFRETYALPAENQSLSKRHMDREITKRVSLPYWIHLPKGYSLDQSYPTILFLHGAGERGTDLEKLKGYGPLAYAQQHEDFPFIVVAPQCPLMEDWSVDALSALLDEVMTEYAVDASRVYLTGYSMGGAGTWDLAIDHAERFAAIAPLCGRVVPLLAFRLWQKPVWVVHGEKDEVVPFSHSKEMADVLRDMGNPHLKFTALPDAGHDVWTQTYNDPALYEWFLSHTR